MCPLTTVIAEALAILLPVGCNRNVTIASFDPQAGNARAPLAWHDECLKPGETARRKGALHV